MWPAPFGRAIQRKFTTIRFRHDQNRVSQVDFGSESTQVLEKLEGILGVDQFLCVVADFGPLGIFAIQVPAEASLTSVSINGMMLSLTLSLTMVSILIM